MQEKKDAILKATLNLILQYGFHGTPISKIAKEADVGVGTIYRYFENKEILITELFLDLKQSMAEIAIENTELFESIEQSNLELTYAYDATIEGWSHALDLRDRETEGHSRRVAELTLTLTDAIGVEKESILHIRRGALLHDIGKMGIPDHILLKEGPLNANEWEIMRKHPVFAYEMLSPIKFLAPALDIPYCHHEKWDGTGYPRGLAGEQIPLAARIFAVADVWDALLSDRPYRKAWSKEETHTYILENSGTHFDPQIVEAFTALPGK
jgi:putative nucleotidyltransferase with HDIG domain